MPGEVLDAGLPDGVRGIFTTRTSGLASAAGSPTSLAVDPASLRPVPGRLPSRRRATSRQAVRADRDLLLRSYDVPALRLYGAEQVHGVEVAVVTGSTPDVADVAGVDALVTSRPGPALLVVAADCMPVLLAEAVSGVVAAAHAGRPGLVAGVLQATVRTMVGLGADPSRIAAVVGPSICGGCYELPAAMVAALDARLPGLAATTSWGTPSVDLRTGAGLALAEVGVGDVRHVGGCTYEQPERFFSYRRDGTAARHGGVVALGGRRGEPAAVPA